MQTQGLHSKSFYDWNNYQNKLKRILDNVFKSTTTEDECRLKKSLDDAVQEGRTIWGNSKPFYLYLQSVVDLVEDGVEVAQECWVHYNGIATPDEVSLIEDHPELFIIPRRWMDEAQDVLFESEFQYRETGLYEPRYTLGDKKYTPDRKPY